MTDIVSRWKIGAHTQEINEKLNEYRMVAKLTDDEHAAFVLSFHEHIYAILIEEYKADLLHKRVTLYDLIHSYKEDVVYPSIQKRIKAQLKEWIKVENDSIYDRIVVKYLNLLTHGVTLDELRYIVDDDTDRHNVRVRLLNLLAEWERDMLESERPKNELGRMAHDAQNIHTLAVSRQTNSMMDILAKVVVPPGQQTMKEILAEWSGYDVFSVEYDMRSWATKSYIVSPGDFLYRKILRSVWAKIQMYPADVRTELIRRLWEECWESVGMCAQGHISRLLNVFVGFDDSAVAEESFQDKMAAISRMDLSSDVKIMEATRIMDALQMDAAERQPWLDAF